MVPEFSGIRSKLYKEALSQYPNARAQDIEIMKKYLAPKSGETILEIGAGSGFFSKVISEMIGENGTLIVCDPSDEQLCEVRNLNKKNIQILKTGSENISLPPNSVDSIWSFGAMHHVFEKQKSFVKSHTCEVSSYDEFKKIMSTTKGFIKAFWCEDAACEKKIKDETKATTRCLPMEASEEKGMCVHCGKPATYKWIFGQSY